MQIQGRADGRNRSQPRVCSLDGGLQRNVAADGIANEQDMFVVSDCGSGERRPHVLCDSAMQNIFAGVVSAAKRQAQARESRLCRGAGGARTIRARRVPGETVYY